MRLLGTAEGSHSKCAEKHQQMDCRQAAGHWAAGAACVEAAVLLTLGPQQQAGEGAELHGKAIHSQHQALGNRVWEGGRRERSWEELET